jgi:hypothetical protein
MIFVMTAAVNQGRILAAAAAAAAAMDWNLVAALQAEENQPIHRTRQQMLLLQVRQVVAAHASRLPATAAVFAPVAGVRGG